MKHLKKVLALVVAMVMVLGTMSTVFADPDPTYDQTITVGGLSSKDSVAFYQILKWIGSEKATAAEVANVDGWAVCTPFNSVIDTKAKLTDVVDGKITSELAGQLSRAAKTGSAAFTKVVAEGGNSVTSDTLTEDKLGLYIAIITPDDKNNVYNPVFVSADYNVGGTNSFNVPATSSYSDSAAAKKSTITLTKTSENANDYNKDNGDTTAVGDEVTFTITATIPGYGKTFEHPAYVLRDTMTNLALDPSTVKVWTDADKTVALDAGNYTVVSKSGEKNTNADATGYGIIFSEDYLKSLNVATTVYVSYDAEVTAEDEPANIDKENNTLTLEYSHDPSTETSSKPGGDKEYKKDITNHYTFSIDADNLWKGTGKVGESGSEIIKIAVDRDGNPITSTVKTYSNITNEEYEASPLANCSFELYKVAVDENGKPVLTNDKPTKSGNAIKTASSDANGRIKFEGLDAGTYILVETEAPAGYVKDTTEHVIVIDADIQTKSITEYYDQDGVWHKDPGTGLKPYTYDTQELISYSITFDGANVASHTFVHESNNTDIKWSEASSQELPASIHNTKGVELPSTGGMGTAIFYIVGAILVLGAGVVLVTRRRMSVN